MKTTSEQFKQAAVSPGRSVMVMIEWDGVLIHANDAGGSLISVAYDYPNETLIGGYSLAGVEFTFLISDSTVRLIESHAPIYIVAGYYNVPDTVRIGPFTVIEDGIVTDNGTVYTVTAMDAGVNADVKYIPIDFAIKPLTGNEVLDQLALQAGLTIHPDKPAMIFDDEIIMGVNAGYSNDVSVRTLISQYAQINLMKAVTVDGQLTFKSAFPNNIDLEITADSYTTSSIDSIVKPINSLVVSNAADGSDEPYQDICVQDEASIELNGLTEFRIVNNRFTDIDPSIIFKMFEVLKNKTTMAYTITDYRMRPDLEPMDNIQLTLPHETDTVVAPVTSIHWEYDGGLNGELMSAGIEETLTDYNLAGLAADVRRAIIRVNDVEGKINITVSNQTEASEKISELELTAEEIQAQVSNIAVGSNIIYNLNFEDDMSGWRFLNDGYLPMGDKDRFYLGILFNSNAIAVDTHSLSKSSIRFLRAGTALSPKGYVVPNSVYSYKARRMDNLQRYTVTVIEYNSSNTEIKRTPFNLVSKRYEEFTIQPAQNTMYIALQFDVYDSTVLTLSEQMFARGKPANYQESAEAVKLWAESQFTITDNQIKSMVEDIEIIDGKTLRNESNITQLSKKIVLGVNSNGQLVQMELGVDSDTGSYYVVKADQINLEGLTTINGGFKVLPSGNVEMINASVSGKITATSGKIAGFDIEGNNLIGEEVSLKPKELKIGSAVLKGGYIESTPSLLMEISRFKISNPTTGGSMWLYLNDDRVVTHSGSAIIGLFDRISPKTSGYSIGDSTQRYGTIYLQNQPNVSSDIRYKSSIQDIDNDLLDAFEEVMPRLFNTEFDNNIHFGYIAQDVERALYKYCLKKYGYEFANEKVKQFAVLSKSESYLSLLYGELTVIKDAYYHREVERLKYQNQALQSELQAIKQFIGMGEK